jgi:hypothetical protein
MPKGIESIKYEGISFTKSWVASQTLAAFKAHEAHHGLSDAQLKEVWDLSRDKIEAEDVTKGMIDAEIEKEKPQGKK